MTEYEKKFKEKTGENFNDYYKQYKPKLTWYLTRYTKNIEMAEEFANIAFVQGLEKIDTYNKEISQFITWLTTIAINLVIKDYKDRQRENTISLDKEITDNLTLSSLIKYDNHEDETIKHEEDQVKCGIIKDVIYNLPEKYKKVMILRELDKMPYKDISNMIIREKNINITNNYIINNDEYFKSTTITNTGETDISLVYNTNIIINVEKNKKKIITKDDTNTNIVVKINNGSANINIKESTNLSTIKSQIKKGRYLIRKKVKMKFDIINEHGIK
jgi:RNA polymerase sigma-70 factor (ECF subfamily)